MVTVTMHIFEAMSKLEKENEIKSLKEKQGILLKRLVKGVRHFKTHYTLVRRVGRPPRRSLDRLTHAEIYIASESCPQGGSS